MRPEDFLADRADAAVMLHTVNKGREIIAAGQFASGESAAVEQDLGAFFLGEIVVAEDLVDSRLVNDGSGEIAMIQRIADADAAGGFNELVGEAFEDLLMHEQAAGGNTAL